MQSDFLPERTRLVMAHPDDEALWASSILGRVERTVLCFGDVGSQPGWSEGRRRSVAEYPLADVVRLDLPESEVFDRAAWPNPVETEYGLAVQVNSPARHGVNEPLYRQTHARLVEKLRPLLHGCTTVATHSPWGEYGHEEHVQVFRAVSDLQAEMGFTLWVPGYASDKSYALMLRHLSRLDRSLPPQPTDPALGEQIKALYMRNGCWTWFDDYVWPETEFFYRWMGPDEKPVRPRSGSVIHMNMLWTNWRPRSRPSLLKRIRRRSVRLLGR